MQTIQAIIPKPKKEDGTDDIESPLKLNQNTSSRGFSIRAT